jgi:hypothetical protein
MFIDRERWRVRHSFKECNVPRQLISKTSACRVDMGIGPADIAHLKKCGGSERARTINMALLRSEIFLLSNFNE